MKGEQCVRFLQWALPQLGMRWPGFRKVRKQVCKRIDRRVQELGLVDVEAYRAYLGEQPDEWQALDSFCRITVSRFYRDREVIAALEREVLPSLVRLLRERGDTRLRIWSAGCGSGEEPFTLAALWAIELQSVYPGIGIEIVATDAGADMIRRCRDARYEFGSLKGLPGRWRERMFSREDEAFCLKPDYQRDIEFLEQDVRRERPVGPFDLVLCRNLVLTYYDEATQLEVLSRIVDVMHDEAALVIGIHERLPESAQGLSVWFDHERIYRKAAGP